MQHKDLSACFSGSYVQTAQYLLAPMQLNDLEEMAKWPRFEEKQLAWANFPAQTSELRKRWYVQQQKTHLQWIIVRDRETNDLIGRCSLSEPLSGSSVMYGIVLHPEMLGQGIGTDITRIMISYIFAVTDIDSIWLESRYDNERAQRTWEKIGFEHQGMHYRREVFGRYDRYIGYEMTRERAATLELPQIEVQYLE